MTGMNSLFSLMKRNKSTTNTTQCRRGGWPARWRRHRAGSSKKPFFFIIFVSTSTSSLFFPFPLTSQTKPSNILDLKSKRSEENKARLPSPSFGSVRFGCGLRRFGDFGDGLCVVWLISFSFYFSSVSWWLKRVFVYLVVIGSAGVVDERLMCVACNRRLWCWFRQSSCGCDLRLVVGADCCCATYVSGFWTSGCFCVSAPFYVSFLCVV